MWMYISIKACWQGRSSLLDTTMTKAVESILMFVLVLWFSDAKGNNHNYAKGE